MAIYRSRLLFLSAAMVFCINLTQAYALKTLFIVTNDNQQNAGPLKLVSSIPYDRQMLDKSPPSVSLTFSQPIKPDKSFIRVYDSLGTQLDTGSLESQGMSLSVVLPELTTGKYSLKWKARCRCDDDTEISETFHFTVK